LIGEARAANELLERRLAAAEKNLQAQTLRLEGYMAEARTDGLTKLPNRRALDAELADRVARWRREGKPLTVLMVDVDHFKRLNDRHGHLVGDQVLQRVAEILKRADAEFVGRYGGEEFCVLLAGASFKEAARLAGLLRQQVAAAELLHEGQPLCVTISCGGATTQLGDDVASLVKRADAALYAAKQAGRNRSYWHDGQQLTLLEKPEKESAAPSAPPAAPSSTTGFESVVADLQKKLQQVARP
jgi:diguanylate cyclase